VALFVQYSGHAQYQYIFPSDDTMHLLQADVQAPMTSDHLNTGSECRKMLTKLVWSAASLIGLHKSQASHQPEPALK